jgi:hypothetical protein
MSMQFWPRELAGRLATQSDISFPIQAIPDSEMKHYLEAKMQGIALLDFVNNG